MKTSGIGIQARIVNALKTQASHKSQDRIAGPVPCLYDHQGGIFQNVEQLVAHTKGENPSEVDGLNAGQAKALFQEKVIQARNVDEPDSSPTKVEIASLALNSGKDRQTSPSSGKKRRAETEYNARRGPNPDLVEIVDPDFSRDIPSTPKLSKHSHSARLFNHKRSGEDKEGSVQSSTNVPRGFADRTTQEQTVPSATPRQLGLIELQKCDSRYPGLLLQPDSHPISQEQLASEVKSIYAGLTMVETKCIHVDRAQAATPKEANRKLAPEHWQALIALHRTLLHEHHDFSLASQHPSASPALRRLASKYTMPSRTWKHGIHSFLELLRQNLPKSLDYMLAFIYLAYQMISLLYETVPAIDYTWIECLGDLGRYRVVNEDHRETWADVARSWYSKAADRNPHPPVGRLYHHLAILARPNALQQLYHYMTSLSCVDRFPTARQSTTTLLGYSLSDRPPGPSMPIESYLIILHALSFTRLDKSWDEQARKDFLESLNDQPSRVIVKWKGQDVLIAVTDIAGWLNYSAFLDCNDLAIFLCTLIKTRNQESLPPDLWKDMFPDTVGQDHRDEIPLPEDYLIHGLLWTEEYLPKNWFLAAVDEEDHYLSHSTHFNTRWPNGKLRGIVCRLRKTLLHGVARLTARLKVHRVLALGMSIQRAAADVNDQSPSVPTGMESTPSTLGSLLVDRTPFDYVMYGILVLYLTGTWLAEGLARRFFDRGISLRVRKATKYCSLALTTAMAFFWIGIMGDRLAAGIYITVIKIWAATTFHFVLVDCCDAKSNFHVANFIGLAMLFEFIGIAMQQSAVSSTLKALPPALTAAAVVNWALYVLTHHVPYPDIEQGLGRRSSPESDEPRDELVSLCLEERLGQQQTGIVNHAAETTRRTSVYSVESSTTTNDAGLESNSATHRADNVSHVQQVDAIGYAVRPRPNTSHHHNRDHDPRFVVADGFDDVSLYLE